MDGFFLSNWVYEGLKWLHEVVVGGGSYFWTIVIFTVILKLVTLPTDIKQRTSSQKMAALGPELEKLKKKYGNDPRKMQEMQAALYKKNGVSMFSSCLPLLITMPIFFAFFGAMRVWANDYAVRMVLDLSEGSTAIFDSFKWLWINNIFQPDTGLAQVLMPMDQSFRHDAVFQGDDGQVHGYSAQLRDDHSARNAKIHRGSKRQPRYILRKRLVHPPRLGRRFELFLHVDSAQAPAAAGAAARHGQGHDHHDGRHIRLLLYSVPRRVRDLLDCFKPLLADTSGRIGQGVRRQTKATRRRELEIDGYTKIHRDVWQVRRRSRI